MKRLIPFGFLIILSPYLSAATSELDPTTREPQEKWQVAYLMQCGHTRKAWELYDKVIGTNGTHDFELLEKLAYIQLAQGAQDRDPEKQLMSMLGAHLAGIPASMDVLDTGMHSSSPEVQLTSLHALARMQDDRCDELLVKAMASDFLPIRLTAGQYLAQRKHPATVGQLEALMQRTPPFFRDLFPEFFALMGTQEAIMVLRLLMGDQDISCRVEAILSAARHGRDDLLPHIRKRVTHSHTADQEACAAALGMLQDSSSLSPLLHIADTGTPSARAAAIRALAQLGDETKKGDLQELVRQRDLFAIAIAGELETATEDLVNHTFDQDIQVRLNASLALLATHDPRALPGLLEILLKDHRDLGIMPQFSPGHSIMAWKVIPSMLQKQQLHHADYTSISLAVRESLLRDALQLGETHFLQVVQKIFDSQQADLVPLAVSLVENLHTDAANALLKDRMNTAGAPLIRCYCALGLFRIQNRPTYATVLRTWVETHGKKDMIRFRPPLPLHMRHLHESSHELSVEETSRLLVEIYTAFADTHTAESIEILVTALRQEHPYNRYALSGLLLRALQ